MPTPVKPTIHPTHQNYRAIFRISLDGDKKSKWRNALKAQLESIGFVNTSTGIWESPKAPIGQISATIGQILGDLAKDSQDPKSSVVLDHVWFYIDRA